MAEKTDISALSEESKTELIGGMIEMQCKDVADALRLTGHEPLAVDGAEMLRTSCAVDIAKRAIRQCKNARDVHSLFGAPGDWGYIQDDRSQARSGS